MTGGRGADLFQLDFSGVVEVDTIADYSPGEGDRLIINNALTPSIQTGLDLDNDGQFDDAQVAQELVVVTLLNFGTTFISGSTGNDSVTGHAWNDSIAGLAGDDTISGLAGADSLVGNDGDDSLNGGDGHDTLLGGGGADLLVVGAFDAADGGDGDDLLFVSSATSNPAGWYNLSDPTATATQLAVFAMNVERWAFEFGNADDTVIGSGGDDAVAARAGNDRIDGLGGNDALIAGSGADLVSGGDGDDVLITGAGSISPRRSQVGAIPAGGYQPGWAWVFESDSAVDSVNAGNGNDLIIFDHLDNIDGGDGTDAMILMARAVTSSITLDMAVGDIGSALSTALGASISNVEVLREFYSGSGSDRINLRDHSALLPSGAVSSMVSAGIGLDTVTGSNGAELIFGDEYDDLLSGGGGNDTLIGGHGNDLLTGGAGADSFDIQSWRLSAFWTNDIHNDTITDFSLFEDAVLFAGRSILSINSIDADGDGSVDDGLINFSSAGFPARIVFLNATFSAFGTEAAETLVGTAGTDTIFGNNGSDRLNGSDGNDALFGGQGADTLDGGLGADLLVGGDGMGDAVTYQSATSQLLLLLDQGVGGSAEVGIDSYIGVERYLLGSGADIVIGSSAAESVDGGAGDDWMDLGGGNDTLTGGPSGNDVLIGGSGNDFMIGSAGDQFYGGAGDDSVNLTQLASSVTIDIANGYTLSGGLFGAIVDAEALFTGSGNDVVVSFTGMSLVELGAGDDWIADYSAGANDLFRGQDGNDALYGLGGDDFLEGGAGVDLLIGGPGNDTLVGGDGFDWLQGGAGSDLFGYSAVSHSRASSGTDAISDFVRGTDVISLSPIDANTTVAGDQAFTIGALQAGQAGRLQITFEAGGAPTWAYVRGDVDGDGVSDFDILVFGNVAGLNASDFIL
jgi:Ca2+-binding RTX toxin-like protein